MISVIKGKDAIIEIDIIDISNNINENTCYDHYIDCNFYYKNNDIFFTSKNVRLYYFQLENLYLNLNKLLKNAIDTYCFTSDRDVISINFHKNQWNSDFLLHFIFFLEWESDSLLQSKLYLSEEQMRDFNKDIHYLMLHFKTNK